MVGWFEGVDTKRHDDEGLAKGGLQEEIMKLREKKKIYQNETKELKFCAGEWLFMSVCVYSVVLM